MQTSKVAKEYLERCLVRGLANKTIEQYSWALKRLEVHCPNLPRKSKDLLLVISDPALALESRKDIVKCLRVFFGWYCKRHHRWPNPMVDLEPLPKRKKLPRVFTEHEVDLVLAAAESRRDRAMVLIILDCGIRAGELTNLIWPEIGDNYLVVRGKVGERIVPLSPSVKRELLGLGDGHHLWIGKKGPLTKWGIRQVFRRIYLRANIGGPKLGAHTLRHTFGTWYIAKGGNVFALQEILGHENLATTQVYVTLARRQVTDDHSKFSPVTTLGLLIAAAD